MITKIDDYGVIFNKPPYLMEQFRNTDVEKLVSWEDRQFNDFEVICYSFFTEMWIDGAVGQQLDVLGLHLDLLRNGVSDSEYKTLLKLKAFIDANSGTPEALITAVRSLYHASFIHYIPLYPALVQLAIAGTLDAITDEQLLYLLPAGVDVHLGFPLVTCDTHEPITTADGLNDFYVLI